MNMEHTQQFLMTPMANTGDDYPTAPHRCLGRAEDPAAQEAAEFYSGVYTITWGEANPLEQVAITARRRS